MAGRLASVCMGVLIGLCMGVLGVLLMPATTDDRKPCLPLPLTAATAGPAETSPAVVMTTTTAPKVTHVTDPAPAPESAAAPVVVSTTPAPAAPTSGPDAAGPLAAGPNVGFCIAGGVRTLPITWDALWANGIEAMQPDPSRRRVIFETTLSVRDCSANPVEKLEIRRQCEEQIRSSQELLLRNDTSSASHPTTRRFDVHVDDQLHSCDHPYAASHPCCDPKAPRNRQNMLDPPEGVWGLRQYLRKAQCSERLREIEKSTGVDFDVVVWIRPDLYLFEPLPPAAHVVRSRFRRVLITSKERGQPPGDYMFIAPKPLTWAWHHALYQSLSNGGCENNRMGLPELRLIKYAEQHRIPTQVYPFLFAIARSETAADCDRLNNEVLSTVSLIDNVTQRYLRPEDVCLHHFRAKASGQAASRRSERKRPLR